MNLSHATELLDAQGRFFSEPYKLYGFTDETTLKDYLDFVIHEPIEWFRGLPAKLVTRGSFAKPKAALIKLLKHAEVVAEMEAVYLEKVYDTVWNTFKTHADAIIEKRMASQKNRSVAESVAPSVAEQFGGGEQENVFISEDDVESVHSVKLMAVGVDDAAAAATAVPSVNVWERRYRVLEAAYRDLLISQSGFHPGLAASATRLLDALSSS